MDGRSGLVGGGRSGRRSRGFFADGRLLRRSSNQSQNCSAVSGLARRREAAWRMRRSDETTVRVRGLESCSIICSIRVSASSSSRAKTRWIPR